MNYYPFHLGDYAAHTGHLEPMEDLAYRRLLDVYYMREGALPADIHVTAKLVRMRSMAADVESVLNEFFTLTPAGWVHSRCEAEIAEMQERQEVAKAKANKRWDMQRAERGNATSSDQHMHNKEHRNAAASKNHAEAYPAVSKKDAGAMLPTPTPTPTPTPNIKNTSAVALPDGVSQSVWSDFIALRKAKKAKLTDTAIARLRCEAESAGWTLEAALSECCARGWVGFKAEWVAKQSHGPLETFAERDERNAKEKWQRMTGQQHPDLTNGLPQHLNIIEADTVRIAA